MKKMQKELKKEVERERKKEKKAMKERSKKFGTPVSSARMDDSVEIGSMGTSPSSLSGHHCVLVRALTDSHSPDQIICHCPDRSIPGSQI